MTPNQSLFDRLEEITGKVFVQSELDDIERIICIDLCDAQVKLWNELQAAKAEIAMLREGQYNGS